MSLEPEKRKRLRRVVADHFVSIDVPISWHGDMFSERAGGRRWGMTNLVQLAADTPQDRWAEMVRWHFESLAALDVAIPSRFEAATNRLRVWLDQRPMGRLAAMYMWRPVAPGLVETLMLQIHGAARNVPPQEVIAWGIDPDIVWKKARENTLWDDPVERESMISPQGGRVTHVTGGFFASSRLLCLDRYLPTRGTHGALAMVPRRHSLLYIHVGEEARLLVDLAALLEAGRLFYETGPGSISGDLFWWRSDGVRRLSRLGRAGTAVNRGVFDELMKTVRAGAPHAQHM